MKCIKLLSIAVALFGITIVSSAQTLQDVADARNKGSELMAAGNLEGAITEFEKCVDLAKKVGEDAEEYSMLVESALPGLYQQIAIKLNSAKDYPAALKAIEATIAAAEKYKNPDVKEKTEKIIPQIYLAMGMVDYQDKKFNEAIANLDKVVALDPNNARAYFIRGACCQQLNDVPKMEESYKLAIEKGTANGDAANAQSAKKQLSTYYFNTGVTAQRAQKWDDAIAAFTKTVEVDNQNADAFYALASCFNTKKSWDNAIANAEKALELKSAESKDLEPTYFQLGTSYMEKKDNAKACECFKKVTTNSNFAPTAKHHVEHTLKCK